MRMLQLGLAGCLVLFLTSSLAPAKEADTKEGNAKELIVGKWQPSDANQKVVVDFAKDGKIKISFKIGEKEYPLDGTYKFDSDDDKSIKVTTKDPKTGRETTQTWKIKSISKDKMALSANKRDITFKKIK